MLIDTHCHLPALEQPLSTTLENARGQGVTRFLCIGAGTGAESAQAAVALAEAHAEIWASVGVHPHDAGGATDIADLESLIAHPKVVAVGETGLDFFRDWSPTEAQRKLFEATISIAKEHKKPLIIHCRDAGEETLETLIRLGAAAVGGVFHCYAEDAEFAKRLRDINFLVSFTGNLTFKKAEALREAARLIPLDQIMLETDCPYMAPEPHRGKPSEPMHVRLIAERLAALKGISLDECAAQTSANAERLFGLRP